MEGRIFVDTQSANDMLNSDSAYIIDSTLLNNEDSRRKFIQCRIRGAKYFNITEIRDTTASISLAWPTAAQFAEAMVKIEIPNNGKSVIVYDQTGIGTASRAWVMLKYFGYPNVFILDGGLPKWLSERRPTDTGEYLITHSLPVNPFHYITSEHHEMRALINTVEQVVNQLKNGDLSTTIWDARPPNTFQNGSVPGAINFSASNFFNDDKTVKSQDEVRSLHSQNGLSNGVITSCFKGNFASLAYVLQKYAGNDNVRVYTGSYEEWKKLKG
ncbi:unnamed protein product [Blepharisma stoltei]|uniref:Rhodanese domain-containing protein n=1 Tax=Blepharisma stoltei TaxID=1481888 RepID=A0AAU9K5Y8_9CILI|nr:unnamed protein product [Blepharisma stoltei]